MAKFSKSRVWSEVPEGGVPLFLEVQKFSYTAQCRIGRRKLPRQKQLDSLVCFDRTPFFNRTPTCDGHRRIRTQVHGIDRASIASRGKNYHFMLHIKQLKITYAHNQIETTRTEWIHTTDRLLKWMRRRPEYLIPGFSTDKTVCICRYKHCKQQNRSKIVYLEW